MSIYNIVQLSEESIHQSMHHSTSQCLESLDSQPNLASFRAGRSIETQCYKPAKKWCNHECIKKTFQSRRKKHRFLFELEH